MDELFRWILGMRGVDVEPGTELQFELAAWPSGGIVLLLLLGIAIVLAGVVFAYRREAANLPRGRRLLLAGLRCTALLLAILLLFAPQLVAVRKDVRPGHVVVLVDASQSMTVKDRYRGGDVLPLAQAWRDLGIADPAAVSRFDLARHLLTASEQAFARAITPKNELRLFRFAAGADPIDPAGLGMLVADGRYTNPGAAVRAALERSRDASIAAVVLIGDGRRNLGPSGVESARLIGQRRVPVTLVLGIGDPSPTTAVELARVDAPEKVFQKDPFRISATLQVQGYDGVDVPVTLSRVSPDGTAVQVATRHARLSAAEPQARIEFDALTSEEPGPSNWLIALRPPDGEAFLPERHERQVRIETLAEQTRVLLLAGGPTHEYRILRDTLLRDKTIDVSCWLTSAAADFPQDGDTVLETLPDDRAGLEPFDVFVLLDPDSQHISKELAELMHAQVVDRGVGLWWIAGEKYTLDALRQTAPTQPLADLLPVVADMQEADYRLINLGRAFPRPWPWELTPDGSGHPMTQLLPERDANERLWSILAGSHFAFPIRRAKPAALVLAQQNNPTVRGDSGPMPLVATQFVGAGRVVYLGTDETFRWRSAFKDAYDRFWVRGIRWLHEGRLLAGRGRVRLQLSETRVELGNVVRVTADVRDDQFRPLVADSFEIEIARGREPAQRLKLLPREESPGGYAGILRPERLGFHLVRAAAGGTQTAEASLEVVPAQIETEGPLDRPELAAIASARGGKHCATPQELLAALREIPSATSVEVHRTPHPIWDGWPTVLLLVGVLAIEWWLRKRGNLP